MLERDQIAEVLGLPVDLVAHLIKNTALRPKLGAEQSALQYAPYVTVDKAAELTGYTARAINTKIDAGVWRFGDVWTYAPDGRRLILIDGYCRWVESGRASAPVKRKRARQ